MREIDLLGGIDKFTHIFLQEVTRIDGGDSWQTQDMTTHNGHVCFYPQGYMAEARNVRAKGHRHWLSLRYEINCTTFMAINAHSPTSWGAEGNFADTLMHLRVHSGRTPQSSRTHLHHHRQHIQVNCAWSLKLADHSLPESACNVQGFFD